MITGSPILDALAFVVFGWVGALLLLPVGQWIDYKKDCRKHGKAQADEESSEDSKEKKPIDFYRLLFYILIAVAVVSLLGIIITVLKMTAVNDDKRVR